MFLAQGHNAVTLMRLDPAAPRSRVKHSSRYHWATALPPWSDETLCYSTLWMFCIVIDVATYFVREPVGVAMAFVAISRSTCLEPSSFFYLLWLKLQFDEYTKSSMCLAVSFLFWRHVIICCTLRKIKSIKEYKPIFNSFSWKHMIVQTFIAYRLFFLHNR